MPLFKVYCHDRAKKVIVCAPTLPELLAGAFKKLQLSGSVEDYKLYDDSDGSLLDDTESLVTLSEFNAAQGLHLTLIVIHNSDKWKSQSDTSSGSSDGSPPFTPSSSRFSDSQSELPRTSPPPTSTSSHRNISVANCTALLKKALTSPSHLKFRNMTKAKRDAVKLLVARLKGKCLDAGDMRAVCARIQAEVPNAFLISIGTTSASCFQQFVKSVYSAVNYANETDLVSQTPSRRRRRRATVDNPDDDLQDESVPNLCLDTNGCALGMWERNPSIEDMDLLEETRSSLLQCSSRSQDDPSVRKDVSDTYDLQRMEFNQARSAADWRRVFARWPCLQYSRLFMMHADTLMGKDTSQVWSEEFGKRDTFVGFMTKLSQNSNSNPGRDTRSSKIQAYLEQLSEAESSQESRVPGAIAIVPLTIAYFKETEDNFFKIVESFSLDQEFPSECPLLLVQGSSIFDPNATYSVLVRKTFLIKADSFLQGSLILLLAYFVFNISYPKSVAKSLEFLQRFFLKVNPELQQRVDQKKKLPVNASVATLAGKLKDFESEHSIWMLQH